MRNILAGSLLMVPVNLCRCTDPIYLARSGPHSSCRVSHCGKEIRTPGPGCGEFGEIAAHSATNYWCEWEIRYRRHRTGTFTDRAIYTTDADCLAP
jgi:hypothetical protein